MTSIAEFEQLQPARFVRIQKVTVSHERPGDSSFEIVLAPDGPEPDGHLILRFSGIQGLKLGDVGSGHWCTLVIEDISDRKWEDLDYAVSDTEEEVFSVFCREFTAVIQ